MNRFYEKLNIPKNCIVDNTVFKKAFLENADLLSFDKKIINEHIKKVTWKYCLKPDTINIQPYRSDERDYLEIEIMEVQLNDDSKIKRIAEIIMRAIPYPILLVFNNEKQIQLAVGDMRKNLNDSSKVTVDDFVFTDWLDIDTTDIFTNKLYENLNIKQLRFTNFYELYQDITSKLNNYNISKLKNAINVNEQSNMSETDKKKCYDEILIMESQMNTLKSKFKKVDSIKEKVEINIKINDLKIKIKEMKEQL